MPHGGSHGSHLHRMCRIDVITWAAGHHDAKMLLHWRLLFPHLPLEECAQPFACAANCSLAVAEEANHLYYENSHEQIGQTIKVLVEWLEKLQPSGAARVACMDRHGDRGMSALACLICNYHPG